MLWPLGVRSVREKGRVERLMSGAGIWYGILSSELFICRQGISEKRHDVDLWTRTSYYRLALESFRFQHFLQINLLRRERDISIKELTTVRS